jgi:hypothetical protein
MVSQLAWTRAQQGIDELTTATPTQWMMEPDLRERAKTLARKLPAGLAHERVRAFYAQLAAFGPFPAFAPDVPAEYFETYAGLRIEAARAALAADISEGLVSETAYLFDCRDREQMRTFAHVRFGAADHRDFIARQKLVLAHKRYVAIPRFKADVFRPLAAEPALLDAARHTLANDWFLAACDRVARGVDSHHRFDILLWAACKLVLRLAGETVTAPGPG